MTFTSTDTEINSDTLNSADEAPVTRWIHNLTVEQRNRAEQARDEAESKLAAFEKGLLADYVTLSTFNAVCDQRDRALRELDSFKQRVRDRMVEEADNRGWCHEFDEILEEFGLEPRSKDYNVELIITVTTNVTVGAQSEDDASEEAVAALGFSEGDYKTISYHDFYVSDISVDDISESD